ncbi:homoserine kinase [Schaalia sp. 19OD2882]|uniref:homoserine kinase n=1 Tax=Schaalia sp. 19OD2882 TaxID=2794089 RepID=UPI001C1EC9E9|nr:homoserine kinase [Schaalia sp. 19OD2882]QWW20352.1 homoserine kinase [Schaalia sp. 19OD2882]
MKLRDDFVAVSVPATTANLGPGFDSMGMALDLWDDVSVHAITGPTQVVIEGEGAGEVATGEDNLVVKALRLALDRVGAPQVGVRMRCVNRIPHGRGLGSSASAIVAGLTLARALIGDPEALTEADLLDLGTEMEGHPDNVAPAVLGGATVAWVNRGHAGAVRLDPPEGISPVAFIPDFELSTSLARAAIPDQVSHRDAVHNVSRVALLVALLSGASRDHLVAGAQGTPMHEMLMAATQDRLHQEQRRSTMETSMEMVDWLRSAGMAAVVSGAGPTVLSLEHVLTQVRIDAKAAGWRVLPLAVTMTGVRITRGRIMKDLGTSSHM